MKAREQSSLMTMLVSCCIDEAEELICPRATHQLIPPQPLLWTHIGVLGTGRTRPEGRHLRMCLTTVKNTQPCPCDVGTLFPLFVPQFPFLRLWRTMNS